ncbi:unnamed protein product [Effrenium voratum]|nr:unnamed protein product [Effrenium voratum]
MASLTSRLSSILSATYTVKLQRVGSETVGCIIRYNTEILLVTRVLSHSSMEEWNLMNAGKEVKYGSRIRSVNGKRVISEMIRELQMAQAVSLEVDRELYTEMLDRMIALDTKIPESLSPSALETLPERRSSCCRSTGCAICLEEFEDETVIELSCGHAFHKPCVVSWLGRSTKCPLCMQSVERCDETTCPSQGECSEMGEPRSRLSSCDTRVSL